LFWLRGKQAARLIGTSHGRHSQNLLNRGSKIVSSTTPFFTLFFTLLFTLLFTLFFTAFFTSFFTPFPPLREVCPPASSLYSVPAEQISYNRTQPRTLLPSRPSAILSAPSA
jgi:hypothetical protein